MRRFAIVTVALVAALLVIGQLALPPYLEHRVEQRLTKQGGHATVHLSAFPAYRLLFKEGASLRVDARGITVPATPPTKAVLGDTDGFGTVDIHVTDARAGPLKIGSFTLERKNDQPYRAALSASFTAADLGAFGGGSIGGPLGALAGALAGGALPLGNQPLPVAVSATLASDHGRPRATAVTGTVAGVPAGPLVEALAAAFGGRI